MSAGIYPGLAGRVVLLTGAASGMGAALAQAFHEQSSRLFLVDLDTHGLDRVVAGLGSQDEVATLVADLSDVSVCEQVVNRCVEIFGQVEVLVNNAAILRRKPLEEVTVRDFDEVVAVNLRAPFFLARAALRTMREQQFGRIINIASVAVRTGGASDVFPYAASKGGLVAITKSLARLGAVDGVLVNAVLPAAVDTPMLSAGFRPEAIDQIIRQIPLGRLAAPREAGDIVLWLASDGSSFVTGASFDVNGGWVMV